MNKYVVLYTGGDGMGATEEKQQEIMGAWGAWYGKMGDAIVDGGNPFNAAKHVSASGIGDGPAAGASATGYTIINAESLDAATQACADHPHVRYGGEVTVQQTFDM